MTTGADWIDQARRLLDAFVQGQDGRSTTDGAHRADCSWCPLCQAAAVVRGERPEVTAALADVLTATASALRTFAESAQPAEQPAESAQPAEPGPAVHEDDPAAEPPPAVQRIEIA
jgi:hypothetical protein